MKSLYESLLDDEDVIVNNIKNNHDWSNVVYDVLVKNSNSNNMDEMQKICIDYLNNHVKFTNNKNITWYKEKSIWKDCTSTSYGRGELGIVDLIRFDADPVHNSLYVRFIPVDGRIDKKTKDKFIEQLQEYFNMNKQDYIRFQKDMIKKFKLERAKELSGKCYISNLI